MVTDADGHGWGQVMDADGLKWLVIIALSEKRKKKNLLDEWGQCMVVR